MEQPLEKIRAPARLQKIAAKLGKYKYALLVLLLVVSMPRFFSQDRKIHYA